MILGMKMPKAFVRGRRETETSSVQPDLVERFIIVVVVVCFVSTQVLNQVWLVS